MQEDLDGLAIVVNDRPTTLEELSRPCQPFLDDHGAGLKDLFPLPEGAGQIDWSTLFPGAVRAFFRNPRLWEHQVCLVGNAKVILVRDERGRPEIQTFYIGEGHPRRVAIPPGVWHGATPLGHRPCGILSWKTRRADPPEVERAPWDAFGKELWDVQSR